VINTKDKKFLNKLGNQLRHHRKLQDLSQEDLAYASDLSLSQIGRIERGEINPIICTLKVIADTLKIELSSFLAFLINFLANTYFPSVHMGNNPRLCYMVVYTSKTCQPHPLHSCTYSHS